MDTEKNFASDLLFEVATPLEFTVRVTRAHWKVIVTLKHPVMANREMDVQETLAHPDEIRLSSSDAAVYLFIGRSASVAGSAPWPVAWTARGF